MPLLFTIFGLMLIHAKPEQTAQNDAVPAEIARATSRGPSARNSPLCRRSRDRRSFTADLIRGFAALVIDLGVCMKPIVAP